MNAQAKERHRRVAAIEASNKRQRDGRRPWDGEPGAIYCRISRADDDDQTGVDRQERICQEIAERLGLVVTPDRVHVDNNRSAWRRGRRRPGWDSLLARMEAGEFRHVIVYHPDRLMRQPRDLEELLTISEEQDVTLHGQANRRDLSDPDDRFFLRIEVAHACRSSDDTSRRLKDALADRARDGRPHTSKRRFGYSPNGMEIIPEEAEIVRDIFRRFLDGESVRAITAVVAESGMPTATGSGEWTQTTVRRILRSPHVTGLHTFRGEVIGEGTWPAITDRGMWNEVQERMNYRMSAHQERNERFYLLRGLVVCKRCTRHMSGNTSKGKRIYRCTRKESFGKHKCSRRVTANKLEDFVVEAALKLLEGLDVSGVRLATTLTEGEQAAIDADQQELAELKDMWRARELSTREYREMRKVIEDRISAAQRKTIVRPTADILAGIVGPEARERWAELAENKEHERMNSILRFLFAAVIIDEQQTPKRTFDYGRIDIEPNPL